jgi:hypothetical protein
MNLFELQERLKDFSQEQLVREMQAPTGTAPQYLVLSELQRRQRMMAEERAQMQQPQTTVAEDAIAAAGVPQGGLADMARAMAPQTDMEMNTAVQPVERMAEGGVVRMQPGGLAGISRDIRDFAPRLPAEIAGVRREDFMLLSPEEQADIIQFEDPTAEMRARGAEVFPEYDPQRTGQGFLIETLTPGRAAEVRASVAAAREAEAADLAEESPVLPEKEVLDLSPGITFDSDPGLSFGEEFGDVDPALVRRGGTEELTFGDIEPTGALIPFALPVGADEDADADVETVVNGGGGAAAPAMDDAFEQDKWLALAQAGLALMSSQQPTIGGAIGEAGLAGITALRTARGERDERIAAQQARADRLAAAAARAERDTISGTERAAYFRAANEATAEADALELALARGGVADDLGMITPYTEEELAILRRQLNDAKSRANIYSGISNPSLANIQATLE